MSYDLAVWFPRERSGKQLEAGEFYGHLCDGNHEDVLPNPAVDAFYAELTDRYPEIDSIPEERIDDHDYCPWSCSLDHSPGHVILSCVWSQAENVARFVFDLAKRHGLVVYDPQSDRSTYPAPSSQSLPSPWKFHCESKAEIPLPPAYTFAQAFNYLNATRNSFYVLEHANGNYMQCGGSKEACSVEMRIHSEDGAFKHYIIGHAAGAESPVAIEMSAGVTNVLAREVLVHWDAIKLFEHFHAGEPLPAGFAGREIML